MKYLSNTYRILIKGYFDDGATDLTYNSIPFFKKKAYFKTQKIVIKHSDSLTNII